MAYQQKSGSLVRGLQQELLEMCNSVLDGDKPDTLQDDKIPVVSQNG